jgi:hypothetical protein
MTMGLPIHNGTQDNAAMRRAWIRKIPDPLGIGAVGDEGTGGSGATLVGSASQLQKARR